MTEITFNELEILSKKYSDINLEGTYEKLTEEEAWEQAKENLRNSLNYCNYHYISNYSEKLTKMGEKAYKSLVDNPYGSEIVELLMDDLDGFMDYAIEIDGLGNYQDNYDSELIEIDTDGYLDYYLSRIE